MPVGPVNDEPCRPVDPVTPMPAGPVAPPAPEEPVGPVSSPATLSEAQDSRPEIDRFPRLSADITVPVGDDIVIPLRATMLPAVTDPLNEAFLAAITLPSMRVFPKVESTRKMSLKMPPVAPSTETLSVPYDVIPGQVTAAPVKAASAKGKVPVAPWAPVGPVGALIPVGPV